MDKNCIKLPRLPYSHERKDPSSLQVPDIFTFDETEKQRHLKVLKEKGLPTNNGNEWSTFDGNKLVHEWYSQRWILVNQS